MSIDLRDGDVIAWPTNRTTWQRLTAWATRNQKPGRHRKPTTADEAAAKAANDVDTTWLLSPAAVQLVTGTRDPIHADVDQATGLLAPRPITTTNQWTHPAGVASDDEIQQWVNGGGDIDDQTTTTGEKDQ